MAATTKQTVRDKDK